MEQQKDQPKNSSAKPQSQNQGQKAKKKNGGFPDSKLPRKMMNEMKQQNIFGNVFFYIIVGVALYLIFGSVGSKSSSQNIIPISRVAQLIAEEKVQSVTVSGDSIELMLKDGTKQTSTKESGITLDDVLKNSNVDRSKVPGGIKVEQKLAFDQILSWALTLGVPLFLVFMIFRQMKGAGNDIMSFGKSRARLFDKGKSKITFGDVAGNEEAKREMLEIVDFLKNPAKYRKLGARIPKGVLLVGPSGVGKTLLAQAIAGEAGVPFFSAAGSEFMEMLVGVGSARVRDLFAMAKSAQPSLIFIDEIDAIGRQRGIGMGGGHDEREQTLNQILTEMDGFDPRVDVIVIGATNRPDMLDSALIRPGRFDRRITLTLPDLKDREEIIKIHMKGKPVADDVRVDILARKTVGFSGADIENMLNEAAILAARADRESIVEADLEEASLKVTIGSERRAMQTDEERKMTAYHEAGHALVAAFLPQTDPVQRISIVARGGSLGHTSYSPERDRYNETKTRLLSRVSTMLGGRAAEEIVFNEQTIGASDDIERATKIVRRMVTDFGMSSLGPAAYTSTSPFFAADGEQNFQVSQEMSSRVDSEVKRITDECYSSALKILTDNRSKLDAISAKLLEKETIDGEEFKILVG